MAPKKMIPRCRFSNGWFSNWKIAKHLQQINGCARIMSWYDVTGTDRNFDKQLITWGCPTLVDFYQQNGWLGSARPRNTSLCESSSQICLNVSITSNPFFLRRIPTPTSGCTCSSVYSYCCWVLSQHLLVLLGTNISIWPRHVQNIVELG